MNRWVNSEEGESMKEREREIKRKIERKIIEGEGGRKGQFRNLVIGQLSLNEFFT